MMETNYYISVDGKLQDLGLDREKLTDLQVRTLLSIFLQLLNVDELLGY